MKVTSPHPGTGASGLTVLASSRGAEPLFGKQRYFFEELAAAATELEVPLSFLTEEGESGSPSSIAAYRFDGTWRRTEIEPFPLVYDRFVVSSVGDLERRPRIAAQLPAGVRYLNPPEMVSLTSNKQAFQELLAETGLPVLPSLLLSQGSSAEVSRLFALSGEIYVKPLEGLRGEGICVITGPSSSRELRAGNGDLLLSVSSAIELRDSLNAKFAGSDAVLMPKASASQISDAPFDVRVLVQSVEPGSYAVTGMGVRIGRRGTWVSNLAAGGEALTLEELAPLLPASRGRNPSSLRRPIEALCLDCARHLDRACGAFAEVAIDLVLDAEGWLILEANAKPGRWLFTSLADRFPAGSAESRLYREIRRRSVEAPLLFARSLAQT